MKCVIIDDSRLSVSALQNMVTKLGHDVAGTAFDGESGVEISKQKNPDVVFLDFVMPNKDGLETARALKVSNPGAKIIMVTQKDLDDSTKTSINAVAYVLKPITLDKIKLAMSKL